MINLKVIEQFSIKGKTVFVVECEQSLMRQLSWDGKQYRVGIDVESAFETDGRLIHESMHSTTGEWITMYYVEIERDLRGARAQNLQVHV